MSQATTDFDLDTFKQAIEERDSTAQLAMYSEDAEVRLFDKLSQPSTPRVLSGRGQIRSWIEDVCGRDMAHRVELSVLDSNGAAFTEACRYPDGTAVMCATVLELDGGLISRQVAVQAWDEPTDRVRAGGAAST
jgi:hypothetical protein